MAATPGMHRPSEGTVNISNARHRAETSSADAYMFSGNYLLVLEGPCEVEGATQDTGSLIVAKTIATQIYEISAPAASTCLAMGISF